MLRRTGLELSDRKRRTVLCRQHLPHFRRHFGYLTNGPPNPHTTIGERDLLWLSTAGCEIADMEFIQFHPSAIYTESEEAFLISEAVLGEGAYLIDQNGERFMPAIHELAELAPRDIVAQSIYRQMLKYDQEYVSVVPQTPRSSGGETPLSEYL